MALRRAAAASTLVIGILSGEHCFGAAQPADGDGSGFLARLEGNQQPNLEGDALIDAAEELVEELQGSMGAAFEEAGRLLENITIPALESEKHPVSSQTLSKTTGPEEYRNAEDLPLLVGEATDIEGQEKPQVDAVAEPQVEADIDKGATEPESKTKGEIHEAPVVDAGVAGVPVAADPKPTDPVAEVTQPENGTPGKPVEPGSPHWTDKVKAGWTSFVQKVRSMGAAAATTMSFLFAPKVSKTVSCSSSFVDASQSIFKAPVAKPKRPNI